MPTTKLTAKSLVTMLDQQLSKKTQMESVEAQELFWQAMEADTESKQLTLLMQVLHLDPGNLDAMMATMRHTNLMVIQEVEILRRLVVLGEKRLGKDTFNDLRGEFWGFIETRPYMRARAELADCYLEMKHYDDAVGEWSAMLELNPHDNQGARYDLLPCFFKIKHLDQAEELIKQFEGDLTYNTVFAWCRVLLDWISNDASKLNKSLAAARQQNPYTEDFLTGKRRQSRKYPDFYSPGSIEEAQSYSRQIRLAWDTFPKAKKWLKELAKES